MRRKLFATVPLAVQAAPTDRKPAASAGGSRAAAEPPLLSPPRGLLSSFFSFEMLLLLYMFALLYKGDSRFAWINQIPVDPTSLFFGLSVVVGGFIIVRNPIHKRSLPVVFAMVCLVAWLWVSLMWSPSRIYGPYKVFLMSTLVLWAVIAGALIIAPDPERLRRLFTLLLLLALLMGVDAVREYVASGGGLYVQRIDDVAEGAHLELGRICGLGTLIALVGWLYGRGRLARWLCLVLFLALTFVLAIGGGRGPLLSTALSLLIPIGLSLRLTRRKILISPTLLWVLVLLLAVPGGLAFYATVTGQRLGTISRLEKLEEQGNPRSELYAEAIELWQRTPLLGHGTGSWSILAGYGDVVNYPHNIFLELMLENGLVGLVLFLALLWVALRPVSLERLRRDPQALCAMMLFANTFLQAQTSSGDLPGSRGMFMMLGVLALFAIRPVGVAARAGQPRQPATSVDLSLIRGRHAATERIR